MDRLTKYVEIDVFLKQKSSKHYQISCDLLLAKYEFSANREYYLNVVQSFDYMDCRKLPIRETML